MGASGGFIGTTIAQSHLKHTLLYLDTLVMGSPEFYLGDAPGKFDENGTLIHEWTRNFLGEALTTFVDFVRR